MTSPKSGHVATKLSKQVPNEDWQVHSQVQHPASPGSNGTTGTRKVLKSSLMVRPVSQVQGQVPISPNRPKTGPSQKVTFYPSIHLIPFTVSVLHLIEMNEFDVIKLNIQRIKHTWLVISLLYSLSLMCFVLTLILYKCSFPSCFGASSAAVRLY